MAQKYTQDELNNLSKETMVMLIMSMQDQLEQMNANMEALIEQIRVANQHRFGSHTEKLSEIMGQLSLFNEAEFYADQPEEEEPEIDEFIIRNPKKKKEKGKRDKDLSGFPEEFIDHPVTDEEADNHFGKGCWRRMKPDKYPKLRYVPASWIVERHTVDVVVGTSGMHQDEFLRGKRPKDLIEKSYVTSSLESAIINAKYVNSNPLYRIETEFNRMGFNVSRQTMSNWTITCAEKYFKPLYDRLEQELFKFPVNQCDETPVEVVHQTDRENPGKCYMWVHCNGEFYTDRRIVLYEYQPGRGHEYPEQFYRDYNGVLVTDGLQQYHLIEKNLEGLTNANCWTHARRDFADAVKAIGKSNPKAQKASVAYEALRRIAEIYTLENELKELSSEERLKRRQSGIRLLVEEFFAWVKSTIAEGKLIKGKTLSGLNYCINQEQQLKVFLNNGDVPIDNSLSERSIRPFTIGRKNWVIINTPRGAKASAVIYSIVETAKLNGLVPFYYFDHLLTELPKLCDENGNIDTAKLDHLLPWSKSLPDICRKPRR
ncbi:IS66 family transposase [Butyrivibrio sp. M55]|uniref:IS66 family transposase n=3 Tax=Butyrivibrio sp. M55 TaxID=1855323 RepID=UPI0008DFEB98|nr:IS66 family transposase [Butyrivibrio sp. M55]SFU96456.1 Transposase C of IS166 homeodomain-containing protein [Butyrivibrio sp. M55]